MDQNVKRNRIEKLTKEVFEANNMSEVSGSDKLCEKIIGNMVEICGKAQDDTIRMRITLACRCYIVRNNKKDEKGKSYSRIKAAKESDVTRQTISNIEECKRMETRHDTIDALARFYGVSPSYLSGIDDLIDKQISDIRANVQKRSDIIENFIKELVGLDQDLRLVSESERIYASHGIFYYVLDGKRFLLSDKDINYIRYQIEAFAKGLRESIVQAYS